MEKEYNHEPANTEKSRISEPMIEYGIQEEMEILPLTEEDLQECITGDELRKEMR